MITRVRDSSKREWTGVQASRERRRCSLSLCETRLHKAPAGLNSCRKKRLVDVNSSSSSSRFRVEM
jgi:hypothetical protein